MRSGRWYAAIAGDSAFFAALLAYAWGGIDPRLLYYGQGPVFYGASWFLARFLRYPGGVADLVSLWLAQYYTCQTWGAILLTAQIAGAVFLSRAYFHALRPRMARIASLIPAALLLLVANRYRALTPLALAVSLGMAAAVLFTAISRRLRAETVKLAIFIAILAAVYYIGGIAVLFFALPLATARLTRQPGRIFGIVYLLMAGALLAIGTRSHVALSLPLAGWGLAAFYAVAGAIAAIPEAARPEAAPQPDRRARRPAKTKPPRPASRLLPALGTLTTFALLAGAMAIGWRVNSLDRRRIAVEYRASCEDWPGTIDAARQLAPEESNTITRYLTNRALYETGRLGDEMFEFPQKGAIFPLPPYAPSTISDMVHLTDLYLQLGRLNDAEHFASDYVVVSHDDPRLYQAMARIYLVKGQTAVARKFLAYLVCNRNFEPWARERLAELARDPQLTNDSEIQLLRRRTLLSDDMLPVWQRADLNGGADLERMLLDQLAQDPTNRMAFEFLMGAYMLERDLNRICGLMPHLRDVNSGPTPRLYQEALAVDREMRGGRDIAGVQVQPETSERLADFRSMASLAGNRDAAARSMRDRFGGSFYYYLFLGSAN